MAVPVSAPDASRVVVGHSGVEFRLGAAFYIEP
jgi:hypothetical protein